MEQVLSEIIEFLRYVMIVIACGDGTELLDVPVESRGLFTSLAKKFDAPTIVHLMALSEQTLRSLKSSTMQRPLFDALIVRLSLSEQFSSIRQLMANSEGASSNPPIAGQKKSSIDSVSAGASAAVPAKKAIESAGLAANVPAPSINSLPPQKPSVAPVTPPTASPEEDAPEESIYEQMKATMRRQKEEIDAKNAAMKQQRGPMSPGRPGPMGGRPAHESGAALPAAPLEKFTEVSDLAGLWAAVRRHLQGNARYLESVLGHSCRMVEYQPITSEAFLAVPESQKGFTNEKARLKIEESFAR